MYVPPHFREDRPEILQDAIRSAGLATLVTLGTSGLMATPVPMMLDPEPAPYGTLYGHIAKANPQWRDSRPEMEALAIFSGPDGYITPAWYATKQETGKVVPTWNYVAIHTYGPVTFFDDPDELLDVVTRLTNRHETPRATAGETPWGVSDAPPDFIRGQLKGIVGFRLPITRLDGKWKMSQNRSLADRTGVAEGLARTGQIAVAAEIPRD